VLSVGPAAVHWFGLLAILGALSGLWLTTRLAVSAGAPQSELCCSFFSSTPSRSLHRSLRPCLSGKVRTSREASFVQYTGSGMTPR